MAFAGGSPARGVERLDIASKSARSWADARPAPGVEIRRARVRRHRLARKSGGLPDPRDAGVDPEPARMDTVMNLFSDIRASVMEALETMTSMGELPEGLPTDDVTVEPPRDSAHGDMATNAALVFAKRARSRPRDIAEILAGHLVGDPRIESAEVAGPGFLNIRLADGIWSGLVDAVSNSGNYGRSDMGAGKRINVEYVSANPTGPLHVGHGRGAVFGDALASLLEFVGYDVTREYYINDGGAQVDVLARSAFERYREACGLAPEIADGMYPGSYLMFVGEALVELYGETLLDQPEETWLGDVRDFATDRMMDMIREDLGTLGVGMDVFFSEKSLYGSGRIDSALSSLSERGLIYEGVLDPPKGKMPDDWEPRRQTLFRSTGHGDDMDRPVRKSDGSWTYFASDIAYHFDKISRGYDTLINVFGADHGGYVKRMKAVVSALSDSDVPLDIKLIQLVRLYRKGAPFKMSKREGNFVTLRDVVDRVGPDVTRLVMLMRRNDAALDFDLDRVLEQSRDNPVFYIQYAHARVRSVLRRAGELGIPTDQPPRIEDAAELAVARKIAEWPRLVETAARSHEPHRVAFYLRELASEFHALWNRGNEFPGLRFVQEGDIATSAGKIALPKAVGIVISSGLGILGVTPAEHMH